MTQRERTEPGVIADDSRTRVEIVQSTPSAGISEVSYLRRNFGTFLKRALEVGPILAIVGIVGEVRQIGVARKLASGTDFDDIQVTRKS